MIAPRLVLLVDEDAAATESLARAFDAEGFLCLVVSSCDEASLVSSQRELSLAIVDVSPPHHTEALRLLPTLRKGSGRPPVMVTSSVLEASVAKAAMHAGAAYFSAKPFVPAEVVSSAARLLSDRTDLATHVDAAFTTTGLGEREALVGRLVLKGLNNREIAAVTGHTEKYVRSQITSIYEKCGVTSRAELFYFVFPS